MARNRKRAKERRARRPEPVTARGGLDQSGAPGPIEHASPDTELAEAQLALGRPELSDDPDLAEEAERADEAEHLGREPIDEDGQPDEGEGGGELALPAERAAEPRATPGNRLVNFLRGSWHELQRVQWPDRRQVMQATGVVIGFVIIAGVFLGVADFLSGKLVNFVIK